MNSVQSKVAAGSSALLALLQFLAGMNIGLPSWADSQGVNLLSAAVLAIAAVVLHVLGKDAPADPGA